MQNISNAGPASRFVPKTSFRAFRPFAREKNLEGRSPLDLRALIRPTPMRASVYPGLDDHAKRRTK